MSSPLKLVSPQHYRILQRWGLVRLLGMPFLVFGVILVATIPLNLWNFATGQITAGQLTESIPGMILAIVMGAPLRALGWVIVFARMWVELDLAAGEAVEIRHWLLFQTRRRVKLADVKGVLLSHRWSRSKKGPDRLYTEVNLELKGKETMTLDSRLARDEAQAESLAHEVAELLKVPVKDQRLAE
jgi:hypothetical protein